MKMGNGCLQEGRITLQGSGISGQYAIFGYDFQKLEIPTTNCDKFPQVFRDSQQIVQIKGLHP